MGRSIYVINPRCDCPSYYTMDIFERCGYAPAILVADLTIVTLAAMAPADFDIKLCEEAIEPIDLNLRPDFVAITGKISQWNRARQIADYFRAQGVTVIIGGPHASLSPDVARPHCDILFRGEMEELAAEFFSDLLSGRWKAEYVGGRPDLRTSPVPRWDLYPNRNAVYGTLQTSRGCPFECEFCDVIEYLGRKQRHKPIDQVLLELDQLYRHGYRGVFLADDNFAVYRARAKELLRAIADWNNRQASGPMNFTTQVSIDAAGDDEMLDLCVAANLTHVFIGIETPNEDSLRLSKKRQNLKKDLSSEVRRFVDRGISVEGGMIVGFDADDQSIFDRQYEFAMSTPVPVFTLGSLVAPAATPLHARLAKEGRLRNDGGEIGGTPWSTNIIPKLMTNDELLEGVRWLCNSIYEPKAFEMRINDLIDTFGAAAPLNSNRPARSGRSVPSRLTPLMSRPEWRNSAKQKRKWLIASSIALDRSRRRPVSPSQPFSGTRRSA